jgi:hypothetical protein
MHAAIHDITIQPATRRGNIYDPSRVQVFFNWAAIGTLGDQPDQDRVWLTPDGNEYEFLYEA